MPKLTSNKTYPVGNILINREFWKSHQETMPTGCIEWRGATHRQGYGMINAVRIADNQAIMTVTHRVAYMEATGRSLTSQDFIVNTCDNKLCVNPHHYILGDAHDRTEMMRNRGRLGLGRRGPNTTPPKKQQRDYRYSEEEIQWVRSAAVEDIMSRFQINRHRAGSMQHLFRQGYRWLPWTAAK